jgi:large subunit ribosomal protein L4e
MSATLLRDFVQKRNHNMPLTYPFVADAKIESVEKTKDAIKLLKAIGFEKEFERTYDIKTRAGKGKTRGRRRIVRKGLLIVVSKECKLLKAVKNIPGFEAVVVDKLKAEHLAPGASPGRMTIFTTSAIERIKNENLFANKTKNKKLSNK